MAKKISKEDQGKIDDVMAEANRQKEKEEARELAVRKRAEFDKRFVTVHWHQAYPSPDPLDADHAGMTKLEVISNDVYGRLIASMPDVPDKKSLKNLAQTSVMAAVVLIDTLNDYFDKPKEAAPETPAVPETPAEPEVEP